MNSVVQKLLQEKLSAIYSSIFFHGSCCQYRICGIRFNFSRRREEPADTTVLDTEIENNINDQEKSKNDAESV